MNKYLYDIITSQGSLSVQDIALRMAISAVFALAVFLSYRITHAGSVYSAKFNITLVTLTVLTTMVMTVIGNNVALSLGMVGALSIVRFRTSIKDSRDTAYIFWTIILGICCGVGDFAVAGIGSAMVFVVLLFLGRVKNENRLLLVIRADRQIAGDVRQCVYDYFTKAPILKAENDTESDVEFIYQLDKKVMEKSKEKERKRAIAEERQQESVADKLFALGDVSYVNTVAQSDEIS